MNCKACGSAQSNPGAAICEMCGELLRPKEAAPGAARAPAPEPEAVPEGPAAESVPVVGSRIRLPDVCCCCLAPASERRSATAVEKSGGVTTRTKWDFPYCAKCASHAQRFALAWVLGAICGFAAFCAIVARFTHSPSGLEMFGVFAAALAVVAGIGFALKGKKNPECAAEGDAVTVDARGSEAFVFRFDNTRFGGLFARLNAR